jgi:hypothetical protein
MMMLMMMIMTMSYFKEYTFVVCNVFLVSIRNGGTIRDGGRRGKLNTQSQH